MIFQFTFIDGDVSADSPLVHVNNEVDAHKVGRLIVRLAAEGRAVILEPRNTKVSSKVLTPNQLAEHPMAVFRHAVEWEGRQ